MIYLTAQRVRALGFPKSAVNSFLHRRIGEALPSGDPLREVDSVAQDPGELVSVSLSLQFHGSS